MEDFISQAISSTSLVEEAGVLDFVVMVEKYCEETKLVCTSVAASRSWASSSSSSSATPGGIAKYEERKYDHTKSSTIEEIQKHTRG